MPGCVHYWELEPPCGPESAAVCRKCGEARSFPNVDDGNSQPNWRAARTRAKILAKAKG
jgi:hypothetical protein